MRLTIAPREPRRCAVCHADLSAPSSRCARCGTALHEECWEFVRVCPTLGCAPRISIALATVLRPRGAAAHHFIAWLVMLAITWAGLAIIVPAFEKMFRETGVSLSDGTQMLVALSHAVWWAGPSALGLTMVAYRRRRSPMVRHALVAGAVLCFVLCLLAVPMLFQPLCGMQRL